MKLSELPRRIVRLLESELAPTKDAQRMREFRALNRERLNAARRKPRERRATA